MSPLYLSGTDVLSSDCETLYFPGNGESGLSRTAGRGWSRNERAGERVGGAAQGGRRSWERPLLEQVACWEHSRVSTDHAAGPQRMGVMRTGRVLSSHTSVAWAGWFWEQLGDLSFRDTGGLLLPFTRVSVLAGVEAESCGSLYLGC